MSTKQAVGQWEAKAHYQIRINGVHGSVDPVGVRWLGKRWPAHNADQGFVHLYDDPAVAMAAIRLQIEDYIEGRS